MPHSAQKSIRLWEPLLVCLAAAIGLLAGYSLNFDNDTKSLLKLSDDGQGLTTSADGRIEEVLRLVEAAYVDSIDTDDITLKLINEMVEELDPHSSYITADDLATHNERMRGSYRGVGIETVALRDTFFITNIMNNSPAAESGLLMGMAIIAVEGQVVSGNETSFDTLRTLLKDKRKNHIELEVQPLRSSTTQTIQVAIDDISVPSADIVYKLNEETAYLKLSRFSSNTYEQFIESIESVQDAQQSLNLILDLRDNPGGYLPQAIKVLSQFFSDKDKLLTYTEGLNRKKANYNSTGKSFYNFKKIAVLIDNNSASGSEIVAGAIQDWDRGVIIGEQSYGKGLVQEIIQLKNGGALRLTVAKYYTPSGRLIQKSYESSSNEFEADSSMATTKILERPMESGHGITPDIIVKQTTRSRCAYDYYVDNYIIDRVIQKGTAELTLKDFSKKGFRAFLEKEMELTTEDLSQTCETYSINDISAAYIRLTASDIDYTRQINEQDETISRAFEFINDTQPTLALLAGNNKSIPNRSSDKN